VVISPTWLGLGEVAEQLAPASVDFLGEQPEIVGVACDLREQPLGRGALVSPHPAGGEPE
jgi:hypothetical protein